MAEHTPRDQEATGSNLADAPFTLFLSVVCLQTGPQERPTHPFSSFENCFAVLEANQA